MSQARAISFILARESGELVHNPGLSRWGIDLSRHPELTADDIENMTAIRAGQIYAASYWDAIKGDAMPDWLQLPLLDAAVNQGPGTAIRCLQRALAVQADGVIGEHTEAAIGRADPAWLLERFTAQRIVSYASDSAWETYGIGWATRAVAAAMEAR